MLSMLFAFALPICKNLVKIKDSFMVFVCLEAAPMAAK